VALVLSTKTTPETVLVVATVVGSAVELVWMEGLKTTVVVWTVFVLAVTEMDGAPTPAVVPRVLGVAFAVRRTTGVGTADVVVRVTGDAVAPRVIDPGAKTVVCVATDDGLTTHAVLMPGAFTAL
jgi:hypothetical protein